jgi:hypothetical protein
MSTVSVKEKFEGIEGKGDRSRHVGSLKVRRLRRETEVEEGMR